MEQTLLLTFTEHSPVKPAAVMDKGNNSEELSVLMQQMKGYLDNAANDLVQPRAEAVEQLLKKVRK